MPIVKLYRHGLTGGTAPLKNDHSRALRGEAKGWTSGAVRRNLAFLRSIDDTRLTGVGYALTLTVRDCPASAADWESTRDAFLKRLQRLGCVRYHWVTEWQRRGVPHLHAVAYFVPSVDPLEVLKAWLVLNPTANSRAQTVKRVDGVVGWFQYVSKHAARGVKHYQRSGSSIPSGWSKTGRVWGKGGSWPVIPPLVIQLDGSYGDGAWFAFRRLSRSWRVAEARRRLSESVAGRYGVVDSSSVPLLRAVKSARTMLRCPDRQLSPVRGVSEWIDGTASNEFINNLKSRGYTFKFLERSDVSRETITDKTDD